MTTKQLDMSFDAMSLRDNGLASPIDRMTQDRRPVPPYQGFHRAKLPDALR